MRDPDPAVAQAPRTPDVDLYVIDVSFDALTDPAEGDDLNDLPTSFDLPPEAFDQRRPAAATIIHESPDFKRRVNDVGGRIIVRPVEGAPPAPDAH
jgi:NTE family protein